MTYKSKSKTKIILTALLITGCSTFVNAQTAKTTVKAVGCDGYVTAGYVDDGAFVNFGGPAIKVIKKPYFLSFGMVPTLKVKEDKVLAGSPKNSMITPTLGFAFSLGIKKHLIIQVPFYYSAKAAATATKAASNGKWKPGFGIGYKF